MNDRCTLYGVKVTDTLSAKLLRTTQSFIDALVGMNIKTIEDFLLYLPRAHEDIEQAVSLQSAPLGEKLTIRGTVEDLKFIRLRGGKSLLKGTFRDHEGESCEVVWFNQPHLQRIIKEGEEYAFTGKILESAGYGKVSLQSPQIQRTILLQGNKGLVPVYAQSDRITSRWIREKMPLLKSFISEIPETLPEEVIKDESLMTRSQTMMEMHFPSSIEALDRAKHRIAFEEIFHLQREALECKKSWQSEHLARLKVPMNVALIRAFFQSLRFTPTGSQKVAIYEILKDMERDVPMSRLLEGDVGSGKTLVAVAVIANALKSGGQCAVMVPTEVLARQHAQNITKLLVDFSLYLQNTSGITPELKNFRQPTVALLTGALTKSEADDIRMRIASGLIDIVIGTHALIEDSVVFQNFILAIVDEQHRFGVMQRKRLIAKGLPHVLAMTATPIPRTLALTAFGDHDLSVLTEKPGNRKTIITKVVRPKERKTVELFIDREIAAGRQVYVICPLITMSQEEDMTDIKSVEAEYERLTLEFPQRKIAFLHGRMSSEEKADVMRAFKERESDILVSTSVIEVGIDVPNSTIIIIEGAERFGLAQLHQLRGRVGRGDYQSYCFLFTTIDTSVTDRLKAMEQYNSGFQLAEIDLKLRGPGELFGLRQSGLPEVRVGLLLDPALVVAARRAAQKFLGMDTGSI